MGVCNRRPKEYIAVYSIGYSCTAVHAPDLRLALCVAVCERLLKAVRNPSGVILVPVPIEAAGLAMLLNLALARVGGVPSTLWFAAAGFFGLQAGTTSLQIKAFDKKKAKYETKDFGQ